MHPTGLPPDLVQRLVARRGRLHVFDRLVPARCALVVIDMQAAFTDARSPLYVPAAITVVPAINRMASRMRAAGGTVAWVRSAFPPSDRDWVAFFEMLNPPAFTAPLRAAMQPGQWGHAPTPGLEAVPADLRFDKDRYSAFLPGACALPDALRSRGIDTVLIAGTLTEICCESSARDAMMQNFRVVMLSDACATRSDAAHAASLAAIASAFGDVQRVEDAIAYLETT
ncbi:MAG: cysteine hydrolase family protein [Gemmobacter sp.]